MSDHEAETTETTWESNGSYHANGSDPGSSAGATDGFSSSLDDRHKFLSDLARVMQSTAASERARNAEGTEQRRQTHIDAIRAREAAEAEQLRELAKNDVKGIDAWSDDEVKRIKAERERRIASRREQLQIRLEEHRVVIAREVEAVEAAIAAYRAQTDEFFTRLESETDPVVFAGQAGNQPQFPTLELIGIESSSPNWTGAASDEGSPTEAVADQIEGSGEGDAAEGVHEDAAMVGVMDPDASNRTFETPWQSGTEVAEGEVQEVADAVAEGEVQETAEAIAEGEIGEVAEAAVAAEAGEAIADAGESGEAIVAEAGDAVEAQAEEAGEAVEAEAEPVPVASDGSEIVEDAGEGEPVEEARVVMPRSSGAGSWLRWPNSSSDRDNR